MNITLLKVYFGDESDSSVSRLLNDAYADLYPKLSDCVNNNLGVTFQNKAKQLIKFLNGMEKFIRKIENKDCNTQGGSILLDGETIMPDFYRLNNKPFLQFMAIENSAQSKILNFTDALYKSFNANKAKYDITIKYYSPIIIGGGQNG